MFDFPFLKIFSDIQYKQLKNDVKESTKSAYAIGTRKNLLVQWRAFLLFCTYFELACLPASLNTICCYAQFLSRSFKSVDSIRNYIYGIKVMHYCLDYPFPHFDCFQYKLLMKDLIRTAQHLPKQAMPKLPEILLDMANYFNYDYESDCVFWCLFLFAFFLMPRKSNLVPDTVNTFDPKKKTID